MKLVILIVLQLVNFSFISSLRTLRVETSRKTNKSNGVSLTTQDAMRSYVASIPDVPISANDVNTEANISTIGESITENNVPQNLDWIQVKHHFGSDAATMKKFLMLRYKDLKFMIFKVFASEHFKKCDGQNSFAELTGTLKRFSSGCVKVTTKDNAQIEGHYEMMAGGSPTFTSDIDLSVNFVPRPNQECLSVYSTLAGISTFIHNYNTIFRTLHLNTSGEAYDVNLYSMDFGNPGFAPILEELKTNRNEYTKFLTGNRLSVLMLIYNDSLEMARRHDTSYAEKTDEIRNKLRQMRTSGCGDDFISESDLFQIRSTDQNVRNTKMIQHIDNSCSLKTDNLKSLCNLLGANFQALEAYVPVGSIIDIMELQGTSTSSVSFGQNYRIDNVLMNFAYAIEHYYEKFNEYSSAPAKFSKYTSRVYRAIQSLTETTHKDCWKNLYTALLGADNAKLSKTNYDLRAVKELDAEIKSKVSGEDKKSLISTFIKGGYNCVWTYATTIKDETRKKKKF
jgi:hypothetical protein